jgi:hypothetical protein
MRSGKSASQMVSKSSQAEEMNRIQANISISHIGWKDNPANS